MSLSSSCREAPDGDASTLHPDSRGGTQLVARVKSDKLAV
jgi:hypothetical protein